MKIAIAGTNGLARWFARFLASDGNHQFILLSRAPKPELTEQGWQVIVVDYNNNEVNLIYNLGGVEVVISVIRGGAQLSLIEAALQAGVRRFIPAEFGDSPLRRPPNDPLDRGQAAALTRLRQLESEGMAHTVFSCGIFYERFGPGGMSAMGIGGTCGAAGEGDYLVNIRLMRSQIPHEASGHPAMVCMTAAQDVARFVVMALDLPDLPTELRMCGSRMNVSDVVQVAEIMR
ncbi:hypothetical protein MMC30_000544, partial [Trapelia coarctata]|nr:hypothetical protein [Trapelia coarctata]